MFYDIKPDERLFTVTKSYLNHEMERGAKQAGVKKIRVHDIRHPYVKPATKIIFYLPTLVIPLCFQRNGIPPEKGYPPAFSDICRILHAPFQEPVYE